MGIKFNVIIDNYIVTYWPLPSNQSFYRKMPGTGGVWVIREGSKGHVLIKFCANIVFSRSIGIIFELSIITLGRVALRLIIVRSNNRGLECLLVSWWVIVG